jgi:hypothetical protein
VYVHFQIGILANEGAGCACMVEMNVGQNDCVEFRNGCAVLFKFATQRWECGGWTGIKQSRKITRTKKGAGDGARMTEPVEIDDGDGAHENLVYRKRVRETSKNFNWEITQSDRVLEEAGGAIRKYLQNDELMEYALGHSDLFIPSRAEREFLLRGTAQGLRNKQNAGGCPEASVCHD